MRKITVDQPVVVTPETITYDEAVFPELVIQKPIDGKIAVAVQTNLVGRDSSGQANFLFPENKRFYIADLLDFCQDNPKRLQLISDFLNELKSVAEEKGLFKRKESDA